MCPVEYEYCRILDSRIIYHDEDTLTGSECVVGEDTDTVMKLKAQWWKQKLMWKIHEQHLFDFYYTKLVYKMELISI